MNYKVVVGNIGTVYSGTSHEEAERQFYVYVAQSREERGRARGESVTLFKDDEILREYSAPQKGEIEIEELTGEDVKFDPEKDILVMIDAGDDFPRIFVDGTPVDNAKTKLVVESIVKMLKEFPDA